MPQNFQIRVISLKDQTDRRKKIENLFANKNIKWSFFDAISGKDIKPFLYMYNKKKRLQTPGYDLRDNEIACFLSHRAVWEECQNSNEIFLILEDDISIELPSSQFIEKINKITEKISLDKLFIRLGNTFKKEFLDASTIDEELKITRYYKDPYGAFGYLISPQIARNLIVHSSYFSTPADDFLWRGWEHGSCLLDIYPSLITTSDVNNPSTIGDRAKPKIGLLSKLKREFFRALDQVHRNSYQNSVIKKIKKNEHFCK